MSTPGAIASDRDARRDRTTRRDVIDQPPSTDPVPAGAPVLRVADASVVIGGQRILTDLDWSLHRDEHAVMLGPNGAGKTTLLRLLTGLRHPTSGTVDVLGERIGRVDVRELRQRIGIVSDALGDLVDRRSHLRRLVAARLHGRTTERGAPITDDDLDRADAALTTVGIAHLGHRRGTEVSEGEWQRTLLARAAVADPELLVLDEPVNGLDLAERERFLADLEATLDPPGGPTAVLVTHHLEEIPSTISHALLLRGGSTVAAGRVDDVVTSELVSRTFDVDVEVERTRGRLSALPAG